MREYVNVKTKSNGVVKVSVAELSEWERSMLEIIRNRESKGK